MASYARAEPPNIQVNDPDHITDDLDNATTQSEPSHAVFGSTIVAGWNDTNQFATLGTGFTSLQGYGFSIDGGVTFTDADTLAPAAGFRNISDPALAVDSAGNYYFATLAGPASGTGTTRIAVAKSTSTSPTVTFGTPVLIPGLLTTGLQDKELIAVDTSGGSFDGRVYVAWTEFASLFDATPRILLSRSTSTSPLSFATPNALSPADALNQGAMPAVGPDGEVYVVWGRFVRSGGVTTAQSIRLLKSTDGGVIFSNPDPSDPAANKTVASPTPAADFMTSGGIAIRTRGFPYIAVDRTPVSNATRGNVYIVFQADPDGSGPDRSDIFFTRSVDGGASWSAPRTINARPAVTLNRDTTSNDNWQPFIAVSSTNGHITVTFYDRRDDMTSADGDPPNTKITLYKAVSTDAGATWFNEPVSNVAFRPATGYDPLVASSYMGDYNYATADATDFHLTWGDTRNTCAPPPGATNPCSPSGRGDQDVFYAKDPVLSGPDLFITPWGGITGVGPWYQSPDIFVVDTMGVETSPAKGQINRLRARVRDLGNAAATGVIIRFKYAPIFAGIPEAAFKEIGSVLVDFAAAGDASGDDVKVVPIDWDLTDLSDTNGGLWPMPISAFEHFCVKISVEFIEDVNLSNNNAQNNFDDVPTIISSSLVRFMIGNPFKFDVDAQLILQSLPKGFKAQLRDFPAKFGQEFKLKASEIKVATVVFDPPKEIYQRPPRTDAIAQIDLKIGREVVGGISVRLAAAGAIAADFDTVFKAVLAVLHEKREPVSLADPSRGLINTGSITVDVKRLREIVAKEVAHVLGRQRGRYLLTFRLRKVGAKTTQVTVTPLIIVETLSAGFLGGQPAASSGSLETEHLEAIAKKIAGGE